MYAYAKPLTAPFFIRVRYYLIRSCIEDRLKLQVFVRLKVIDYLYKCKKVSHTSF